MTLTASPSAGSMFTGWSGACSGTGSCVVSMTQAESVTAAFVLNGYLLSVTVAGPGSVTSLPSGVSCPGDCSETYPEGTSVTLTASPSAGSMFTGWSGACKGKSLTCKLRMKGTRSITASFSTP